MPAARFRHHISALSFRIILHVPSAHPSCFQIRRMLKLLAQLLSVLLLLIGVACAEERSPFFSQINVLTGNNFNAIMKNSEDTVPVWLLDFYAPWCGHCKKLAPVLETIAADESNDLIAVGTIDATAHRGLGDQFKVKGFPTIYWRYKGEDFLHKGGRTKEGLMSYGKKLTEDAITDVGKVAHFGSSSVVYVFDGTESEAGLKVRMDEVQRKSEVLR